MKYWRMAMREGEGGPNRFPDCKQRGIAALDVFSRKTGQRVVEDCRKLTADEYEARWRQRAPHYPSGRYSLRQLWQEMKCGDVIFAKIGPKAVGKGVITAEYAFDPKILAGVREMGKKWGHFVRVQWEEDFPPFSFRFSVPRFTVRKLEGKELEKLSRAEKLARKDKGQPLGRSIRMGIR